MKTKEDFMMYFNCAAFKEMNAIYGYGTKLPVSYANTYYDAFVFLRKAYRNIEEFKNDADANTFVNHVLKYLEEYKDSIDVSLYDTSKRDKITGMHYIIEKTAKEGGFIE